jgi:hypothetical protein
MNANAYVLRLEKRSEALLKLLGRIHVLAEIQTAGDAGKRSMSERLETIWQLSNPDFREVDE